ncbi:hypothetical protein EKH55_4518 [Sinorhizobium alkalisoli]|nr:hypothetical protein EKH55_4518 [Sinorhizobium alkalisoli]
MNNIVPVGGPGPCNTDVQNLLENRFVGHPADVRAVCPPVLRSVLKERLQPR